MLPTVAAKAGYLARLVLPVPWFDRFVRCIGIPSIMTTFTRRRSRKAALETKTHPE